MSNLPATNHDLIRHLANTLVENEVIQPMNSIGWADHLTPPSRSADNPPTGEASNANPNLQQTNMPGTTPARVDDVQTSGAAEGGTRFDVVQQFESLRDQSGMILGKYKNVEEAIRGVGHAVNMAKDAFAQRDAAAKEAERLREELNSRSQSMPVATPATAPLPTLSPAVSQLEVEIAQKAYDEVLSKVVENGGFLDEDAASNLSRAQSELLRVQARAAAEEALVQREGAKSQEQNEWDRVNTYMEKNYPESMKFTDEIGLFVESDPVIGNAINALVTQGQKEQAAVLAWTQYQRSRDAGQLASSLDAAKNKEVELQAYDQVRKEAVERARIDAGIPGSAAGGVHERVESEPSYDEIRYAADAMRAYGMTPGNPAAARWRELTIGKSLPPEIFGA